MLKKATFPSFFLPLFPAAHRHILFLATRPSPPIIIFFFSPSHTSLYPIFTRHPTLCSPLDRSNVLSPPCMICMLKIIQASGTRPPLEQSRKWGVRSCECLNNPCVLMRVLWECACSAYVALFCCLVSLSYVIKHYCCIIKLPIIKASLN